MYLHVRKLVYNLCSPKIKDLQSLRKPIEIKDSDLDWKYIKGGGPGGQSVNKSVNCVQLTHIPSGIQIKCHKSRDLYTNRNYAIKFLKEKLDDSVNGEYSNQNVKAQKIKSQKSRRERRSKEKYQISHAKQQEQAKGETDSNDQ